MKMERQQDRIIIIRNYEEDMEGREGKQLDYLLNEKEGRGNMQR